jgi:hypothetical protein
MTAPYRVEVNVGSYGLSAQDDDPAGYGLTDGLELRYGVPNADLAPLVQQDPAEASFGIIAPDSTTYRFQLGDQVRVAVYNSHSGGNGYYFWGRVAQLTAQPHKLGILYSFTCVDYMADLQELKAGRVDYPQESSLTRCNRMLAENGLGPLVVEGIVPADAFQASARVSADEGVVPLTEALEEVLAGWTESQTQDETGATAVNTITARYELRPNIVNPGGIVGQGTLDTVSPFKLTPIMRPQGWTPPARPSATPQFHLTVATSASSPSTQNLVLDAGGVEFNPLFTQQKGNNITRTVVQCDGVGYAMADWTTWGTYQYALGVGTLEATVKTRLVALNFGAVVAAMYRGTIQPDPGLSWTIGELIWRAGRTQAAGWQGPQLRRVCTIARVDAVNTSSHVPTGKAWVTGVVDGLRVRVEDKEVVVGFTLAPMHETQGGALIVPHQMTLAQLSVVTRRNLALNPSLESSTGLGNYGAVNPGSFDTTQHTDRLQSYKCAPTSGTGFVGNYLSSAFSQLVDPQGQPLAAGSSITWSTDIRRAAGTAQAFMRLEFFTAGGVFVSGAISPALTLTGSFTRQQLTAVIPATATQVKRIVYYNNPVASVDVLNVDRCLIEAGSSAGSYFDGATAAAGVLSYSWSGTAETSQALETNTPTYANLDPTDTFADYLLAYA